MGASIKDILGDRLPECLRNLKHDIRIGNVYKIGISRNDGIYIKDRDKESIPKYFVVIGFDEMGNIYGGVVISTDLPSSLTDKILQYQYYIKVSDNNFLKYDSWVNCYLIIPSRPDKLNDNTFLGVIDNRSLFHIINMILDPKNTSITDAQRRLYNIKLPDDLICV